ncbi:MAG TPA: ABC transporter substrate-binding protein [Methylomirabilota bacterium]|jgi:putative ABC transport system substrate-binding protein
MTTVGVRAVLIASVALALLAGPVTVAAQAPSKVFRVGYLSAGGRTPDGGPPGPLREALRSLGYVEGRNIAYEVRFAEGKLDRLPGLAAELVALKPDVIGTQGGRSTVAAKQATTTIPIVIALSAGDAVAVGWIASLARPGGNVTGMSDEVVQLSAKRMEILKEAAPQATRIAVVWNREDAGMTLRYREIEKAARTLNVDVQAFGVREPADFPTAFAEMTRRRPDAMFVVLDALTNVNRKQFIEFAASQRIPAMYEAGFFVHDGGLMSYGSSALDEFRRAAAYIDRILKGAKPADLPAEQPTRYYLSINMKTAAALGLTVPPSLLLRADDVVQ